MSKIELSRRYEIITHLRVVEVGGDGDDGIWDLLAEVGFGGLAHLGEDHGGDLLGEEGLLLTLVLDLDLWLAS